VSDPQDPPDIQVVVPAAVQGELKEWLGRHGWYLFLIGGGGRAAVYGIGPDWQPGLAAEAPLVPGLVLAAPAPAGLSVPRYEASMGIRPPNRNRGRVRGVVYEVVQGGRMELWSCQHDHAPGVRDVRHADDSGREAALLCAENWAAAHIQSGGFDLPVVREEW
jgi:hypothetical protein